MSSADAPRTMHIGELADRTALSHRTIRHYDEVGLLPASARTDGGFRIYTEADYQRLMLIRQMKPLGFSLEEMAGLLSLIESDGSDGPRTTTGRGELSGYLERARSRREKMARNLADADDLITLLRQRVDHEAADTAGHPA